MAYRLSFLVIPGYRTGARCKRTIYRLEHVLSQPDFGAQPIEREKG
jgi:hypothetical protein